MGLVTEKEREFTAEGEKGYENGYTKIGEKLLSRFNFRVSTAKSTYISPARTA